MLQAKLKKFFDDKMGDFLKAEKMEFNYNEGYIGLQKAEFITKTFEDLHFPFALRGGFIDEMSIQVPVSMFGNGAATVNIKNVFLVFGPHVTDWTWDDVFKCKTRLVDLIMKIYELKPVKSKKKKVAKGGWFEEMKKKMVEDLKQKFLGMLEVKISNIHFRYEDAKIQNPPFACGFNLGVMSVNSKADAKELRTTGDWKHSSQRLADVFFCQQISARRISAYWDIGVERKPGHKDERQSPILFEKDMVPGEQVFKKFSKMNLREIFSLAVVEKVLQIFPPDCNRRMYLEGPCFRERLDYHRYVLFPASLNAHVTVNRPSDIMKQQKAPLKDADVIFDPVEIALDSEQMRSLNQLLAWKTDFKRRDDLFRTKPRDSISKHLNNMKGGSSSSSKNSQQELERRKRDVVRAWWHHALQGVRIMCSIPKSHLDQDELKQKSKLREEYIKIVLEDMENAAREKEGGGDSKVHLSRTTTQARLQDLQMRLPLADIFSWRSLARERRAERLALPDPADEDDDDEERSKQEEALKQAEQMAMMPNTMQVRMHYSAFQAFFLIVADNTGKVFADELRRYREEKARRENKSFVPRDSTVLEKLLCKSSTRQLVIKAQTLDIRMEAVQKGRNRHRIARWAELGIGSISVTNCNAKRGASRQILSIIPFEHRQGHPLCVYVGITTLEAFDKKLEPGDMPIQSVLEPSEGVSAHLQDFAKDRPELIDKLGFLKEFKDELGRLMIFAFVRVGQVRALDYSPFRRRLEYFLKRGKGDNAMDLVRRPSPLALDRELLVKLQRKVEKITGKSNMLGIIEGVTDGVRGRLVDHYNSAHVLCKEMSLAPMRCKALRNGCPQTFHCQFHQMLPREEHRSTAGESFGLLPWKAAMLLLPKTDFAMGLDLGMNQEQEEIRKMASPKKSPKDIKENPIDDSTLPLIGTWFLKWGRNGKAKKRFVYFDEKHSAICWADKEMKESETSKADKIPVGLLPLSKVQDICNGVKTPVLQKVKSAKLQPHKVFSIVATDRTLDLQADTHQQREKWVNGLKSRYKKFLQIQSAKQDDSQPLPPSWAKKVKQYPETYRSDLSNLKQTNRRLQTISTFKKSIEVSSSLAANRRGPQEAGDEAEDTVIPGKGSTGANQV